MPLIKEMLNIEVNIPNPSIKTIKSSFTALVFVLYHNTEESMRLWDTSS